MVPPLAPEAATIACRAIPFDLTIDSIEGMWGRAREAAGMPDVWLTDLRHFFGTQLVGRGADAATVRDLIRHGSLAVTSPVTFKRCRRRLCGEWFAGYGSGANVEL